MGLTFKMYTFNQENMFSMVNTMMNDPEFKKLAQNFEDQMKNTMEEMKKAKTNENQKASSENSSSPKTTEKSCSSSKTRNCSKTENSSACPMCNPMRNNQKSSPNSVSIPLRRFTPEQVQLNMNKNGLVTITASRENTEESNRNAQRKTTIMIEET